VKAGLVAADERKIALLSIASVPGDTRFNLGVQLRMRRQRLFDQRNTDRIDRRRDAMRIIPVLFRIAPLLQNS
jgi:hypothetical protein